jgi:hypothetical protein
MAPPSPQPFGAGYQRAMAARPNRTPAFVNRLGLYEKGVHYRAKKEERIRVIREQMMENCTFTPNTAKSQSTKSTQPYASSSQSSHSPVWDRLYPHPSSRPTAKDTVPSNRHKQRESLLGRAAAAHPNDNSTFASHRSRATLSTAHSTSSMRIEQLYEHGRSKLRNRPLTDRAEAEWRRQRHENEQLKHCTFHPRTTTTTTAITAQHRDQSRRVLNLQNDAKELRRNTTRSTQHHHDQRPKYSGTSTISIVTPQHDATGRWNRPNATTTTTTGRRRGSRYPSEITVVTRPPHAPAFEYSSPPPASTRLASATSAGRLWRDDAKATSTSVALSPPLPPQEPEPPSHLWRTPSPSPPRPPPLPPTRRRLKRENDDFMVDLSSFFENPPHQPTILFHASFDDPPGFPGQQRHGGGAAQPFHAEPPPQALPKAVPDSVSHSSTISTEYGSI